MNILHGTFQIYQPVLSGPDDPRAAAVAAGALFLKNGEGRDWYDIAHATTTGNLFVAVNDGVAIASSDDPSRLWPVGCAVVETDDAPEIGAVWNGVVFSSPPAPVPQSVTRRQLMIGLVQAGIITAEEWQASYSTGDLPGAVQAAVATLPTEAERIAAKITWAEMEGAARNHPLVALLAAHTSLSSEQVDDMFRAWADL